MVELLSKNWIQSISSHTKVLKCITTPVKYNGSTRSRWQTNTCVGGGLCYPETFQEVFNKGEARAKNGATVSCAQPTGKFCCKPMVPVESVHFEGVHFAGLNLPDIKNPKWGT